MPALLRWWLYATLGIVWLVAIVGGGSFGLSLLVNKGEASFSQDQRAYLIESMKGGIFTTPSTYRWCDGNTWVYFDSRGDTWTHNERCWRAQ